jgi:hypothetical protein
MTSEETGALQRLLDEAEIRRVLQAYCRGIDRLDADLMASIYHEDAYDFHGSGAGLGKDFGRGVVERAANSRRFATMHFLGETTFAFDGDDVAHTETYIRASIVVEDGDAWRLEAFFGRYLDRFERRDGTWLIARRITVRDFMGATPVDPMLPERPFQGRRDAHDPSYAHLGLEPLESVDWPPHP